jgi:hypothetical protein
MKEKVRGRTRTAAWVRRVQRAMQRVMPADGQWHQINVTQYVHTGTGAVRFRFHCRGRESSVDLTAAEMDEIIRRGVLLGAEPIGHG